jgi:glycosyltransferase involved in cell wall biosynthesis
MHIAHFVQRYPPARGGSEAYFARLTAHLTRCGDHVDVWTTTAKELLDFRQPAADPLPSEPRVRRYPIRTFPGRRYLLKAVSMLPVRTLQALTLPCNPICPGLWSAAGRFDGPLDAVHAGCFPYTFPIVCGLRLARRRKVPFFLTPFLHLGDPDDPDDPTRRQFTRPVLQWLTRQADGVFVQTEAERRAVQGFGVPDAVIVLQGLGVDPGEVTGGDRNETRKRWGVTPQETVIGHLANLSVEKGTVDLLIALKWLFNNHTWKPEHVRYQPKVVLAGPSMPNFEAFWEQYPLKDRVLRLGELTDADRKQFYAGLDVFALPSKVDSFGLVLLEAWANGLPVVVYRAGGPGEIVRHKTDGYVVDCQPGGLMHPLLRLCTERPLGPSLGEAGKARLRREFRWADKLDLVRRTIAVRRAER